MNKISLSIYLVLVTVFIFAACQSADDSSTRKNGYTPELKTKEDSLFHDVMEGHDAGMARMNVISKYLDKTKTALDSLQKLPIEKVDILYRQDLLDLQEKLSNAKNAMNSWMDGFKIDSAKGNTALREQYLENEKEKINKVKDDIMKGLEKADSIFNK